MEGGLIMLIKEVEIPGDSLISKGLSKIDFSDAFKADSVLDQALPLEEVAKSMFKVFPVWVDCLLDLRDKIVKPLGLKTADKVDYKQNIDDFQGREGEYLGFFKFKDRNENEIMFGENDKHLEFRASFMLEKNQGKYSILFVTIVCFNNLLGRVYFLPVKHLHRLIVKESLRKMVRYLNEQAKI